MQNTTRKIGSARSIHSVFILQKNNMEVWLDHAIYGDGEKWFFLGRGKFQYFPMKYYGVGIKSPEEGYAVVSNTNIQLRERVLMKNKRKSFCWSRV